MMLILQVVLEGRQSGGYCADQLSLGPLLWLVDVWLEMSDELKDFALGPLPWLVDVWLEIGLKLLLTE
jgi:hypothetical protein